MADSNNKSDLIKELAQERKREGCEPYTTQQLLDEFMHIRDSATIVIKQCLEYNGKGLKNAQDIFEYARTTIKKLKIEIEQEQNEDDDE